MVFFKLAIKTVVYILVGIVLFLSFINFIQFNKSDYIKNNNPIKKIETFEISQELQNSENSLNEIKKINAKLIKSEVLSELGLKDESTIKEAKSEKENKVVTILKNIKTKVNSINIVFFDYIQNTKSSFIALIYITIFITFIVQTTLFAISSEYTYLTKHFLKEKIDNIFLYLSEWTINSPPVLGVVGTIYAFGVVVNNLNNLNGLSTIFKENFADAALTTIIGGSVYVLNLFMNVLIAKNLSVKEQITK